ncbi:MAG: hypothetical protein C0483_18910 [Pirellula sp.]|nr:hypothetical protein [Pirellula sp.]
MSSCRHVLFAVLLQWSAAGAFGHAAETNDPLPWDRVERLPSVVAGMLQDQKYAEAAAELKKLAAAPKAQRDRLLYAEGRAWHFAGKYDEAAGAFLRVEEEFPKSPWARRARFARGVSLAKKGDFASAELIYRAEAEYLLSHERKQELADVYLGFARKYATPRTEHSPPDQPAPDYAKALEFFQQAIELGPKPELRPEIEMQIAECYRLSGNYEEAANRYAKFVKDRADEARTPEARYRLGECRFHQDRHAEARRAWQDLVALWPGDKLPAHKTQADYVARSFMGIAWSYRMPSPADDDDLVLGIAATEAFLARFPEHKLVNEARLGLVQARMVRGRFAEATTAAEQFLSDAERAAAPEAADVRNLLGSALLRQGKFIAAIAAWRDLLAKHPAHGAWSSVQQQLIEADYLIGAEAFRKKDYVEARKQWSEFLLRYPLDSRSPRILFHFGQAEFLQEHYDAAIEEWRRLISKYPGSEPASEAQFMIGRTLEEQLGKPADAMQEYKKLTWGAHVGAAHSRLGLLTAKQVNIETERVFRTHETPSITLRSRNVDKVTVRVYKLDLETYFRKMHLAGGVEGLDLALIDPDRSFEFAVPDYADFKPMESSIDLPGLAAAEGDAEPGVVAVTVSGKTLEATTLVIRSDLDVIVKSSRDETFVFAQNMRTGKPWPGARVLISDGAEVVAEAATGKDGVYRASPERLKATNDVRVFAVADGNTASNIVSLNGVGVSRSLEERGFLYTDRSGYQPGQVVHVRGVLRAVADEKYVAVPKRKYRLDTYDARSRLVYTTEVATGDFGTFHAFFTLPATAAPGDYRVQASDIDGRAFTGTFRVENYQLEPVRLVIDLPRKVYFRGEEIEGTIRAEYYYGTPLVGRELRYTLGDGETLTGTTDDEGRVKFKFPTRELREEQQLRLTAELPERNLYAAADLVLAVRAFSIGVTVPRDVVTVGETFPVTIKTTAADGKPTAEKVQVEVIERTVIDNQPGEKKTSSHDVTTDAKTGEGRLTLALDKGARYIVRVAGKDRFGNPVVGSTEVFVSGDEDTVRLRILADVHNFRVGDEPTVRVHWREAPALALVTFQGARILDYRLVELKTGDNLLKVPMQPNLAPNFFLEVNIMTDVRLPKKSAKKPDAKKPTDPKPAAVAKQPSRVRLHSATNQFYVERALKVALEVKPKTAGRTIRPGDAVDVAVRTLDAQGRPVAAELGLAVVDRINVDRFGEIGAGFASAFIGLDRQPAMRTASSISFAYRPETRPINPRLLSEEQRLEIAAQEEELRKLLADTSTLTVNAGTLTVNAGSTGGLGGIIPPGNALRESLAEDKPQIQLGIQDRDAQNFAFYSDNGTSGERSAAEPQTAGSGRLMLRGAVAPPASPPAKPQGNVDGADAKSETGEKRKDAQRKQEEGEQESLHATAELSKSAFDRFGIDASQLSTNALNLYYSNGGRMLTVVRNGVQDNVFLGENLQAAQSDLLVRRLKEERAVVMAAMEQQETAYWNPAVVTDAEGRATITVTLPERSTSWNISAKGITVDSLTGQAEKELTVKKELFGELAMPSIVTDGDSAQITATIHDLLERVAGAPAEKLEVTFTARIGDKTVEEKRTIASEKAGMHELAFALAAKLPVEAKDGAAAADFVEITLEVAAGERRDVLRRTIPIRPLGYTIVSSTGGSATSDTTAWLEEPAGMTLVRPKLEVVVGAQIDGSLLDIVLGTDSHCGFLRYASPLETTTSDLLAALALEKYGRSTRTDAATSAPQLASRIRSAIGHLVSAQLDNGSWTWTGNGTSGDRYASARCLWALGAANAAGYKIPDDIYDKGISYLQSQLTAVADDDLEGKAILLHALAETEHGDFSLANRLYRGRSTISPAGAAYLALALAKMNHTPLAADLLVNWKPMVRKIGISADHRGSRVAEVEAQALYGLALTRAAANSPKLKESVDWLLAHREGRRWSPDAATGPAAMVVAEWFAQHKVGGERYSLTIVVNEREAAKIDVDPTAAPQTIAIAPENLKPGKQRIQFLMTGRGHLSYQCTLTGFVAADKLKNTTNAWFAQRIWEPALREFGGRELPRGFSAVEGSYSSFHNPLTQLPIGRRGRVELRVHRNYPGGMVAEDRLEYLVVREPLPAGTAVVEQTIRGGFERYELLPGEIVFYVGNRRSHEAISFDVVGAIAGDYRAAPPMIFDAHRPEQFIVEKAAPLTVLPRGKESVDAYRWSPDELYELGKRNYAKRDWKAVRLYLAQMLKEWPIRSAPYQDTLRMLLDAHLELGPAAEVVRYFELVKEKSPELEIPFENILKVGAAYHELGEYERSYLVFHATVESSFYSDGAVAGFLEAQGEFLRSVDVMRKLISEYPPEPYVASAEYALAQRVYGYAPSVAGDAKLRQRKLTRLALVAAARSMLDDFLTAHPDDPAADQAAFAEANAFLELQQYDQAVASCLRFAERYPESDFLDSYWYIIGYSHFAAGRPDQALEMCRKVAEMKRPEKGTGREVESRNKQRALYILGQIYHSLGKAAEAIKEYTLVADQIPDAKKAIEYFTRRSIELPEVTTIRPGTPALVKLEYRNVPKCELRAYRIDLMKFSLLRQNLEAITQINLSGIRPLHEETIELGDGKDYRDRERELKLPLDEEGAYLIVCRGENLHTSGFVLISPLKLEVQQDAVSGQVRTTLKNALDDKYASHVHVKVIGTRDSDFKAGETDLRGVFSAEPISGRATVIAQSTDNRYAFYRGETDLLPQPAANAPQQANQPSTTPAQQGSQSEYLLQELNISNGLNQRQQIDNLRDNYYNNRARGVKAKAAK